MPAPNSRLATPPEVAEYLQVTVSDLAQKRFRGAGPKFVKLGNRQIRYRWSDVQAWLDQQTASITGS
ncbi:helix-turn-helix domain-containing protein [Rhodococcus sp. D2-41]|uniref:helix-turn-helix transcriptional regulator n=1 Tax=Speluncibacter jeojiensis TaxID=2710754 RepID=UPI0024108243|nr:helix-turn-helix domain-containing protein [Rhodococcus sp. D2-41]MDG3012184.1 helix-turn-helix domain-containing protein [Rhodococcus sp. D2-41]